MERKIVVKTLQHSKHPVCLDLSEIEPDDDDIELVRVNAADERARSGAI